MERRIIRPQETEKQKQLDELFDVFDKIEKWGIERGLGTGDGTRQLYKLVEEMGELASGMAKDDRDAVIDAIGDMAVVVTIFSMQTHKEIHYQPDWATIPTLPFWYITRTPLKFERVLLFTTYLVQEKDSNRSLYVDNVLRELSFFANMYDVSLLDCMKSAYMKSRTEKEKQSMEFLLRRFKQ